MSFCTSGTSMNFAPRLSTCSFTAGRMSNAETIAPSRFAVAIAWRPATPAPSMKTDEGRIVPAAVIIMGMSFPRLDAATNAALYPAILLCDDNASMDCARVMRGTRCMLSAVTRRAASTSSTSRFRAGCRKLIRIAPSLMACASSTDGGWTFRIMSAFPRIPAAASTTVAPASRIISSVMAAPDPAPASAITPSPVPTNFATESGTSATRFS